MQTYIINRDDRPERLADIRIELEKHEMNASRMSAFITKPGWIGCAQSHVCLLDMIPEGKEMLIMEDDVVFLKDDIIEAINLCKLDLPLDWDCLYLGGSPREPQERYSSFLYRARNVVCAHAIIWRNRPKGAVEYILSHKKDIKKIDRYYSDVIQLLFNCFMCRPILAVQRQYPSDTCLKSDVSTIYKNYLKFCK